MNTANTTSYDTLATALTEDGYRPGAPAHVRKDCLAIDKEVCRGAECEECGQIGLKFHPWHCGRSYRAVATCPCCGHSFEF
jgi:hypothetical protein